MRTSLLAELRAYGQQLVDEHVALRSFQSGAAADILAASRGELRYPVLWLEIPDLRPEDNGAGLVQAVRDVGLVVLDQIGEKTQDEVFDSTEQLAIDVLSRLLHDRRLRQFGFDLNKARVEAVSTLFVDNERGWRLGFPLTAALDLCYDASRWQKGEAASG